ncbi:putative acyl-(acyl-carrier-protein)--UDP-N-acetylglucosamine O-acyltransferase, mitochondrial [Ananas comosus]|uniref:Putative acyl-(Acyl-carrier-protein)--UDP-N-acetylglucosamine O-acyltransferase, mitochondrial n=1 Tax=Ananas comosus TaxID=4615 RepID=A0A199VF97_ANACO|nr:putative acyl-(acyl-carrier-protein)--UDP-N-acetylglucosamine O-acyltransferase, mitochondrial [Ananas comosus]
MAMAAASSSLRSLRALSISRALSPLPLLRGFALRLLHQGVLEEGRRGGPGSVHPTAVVHADAMIGQFVEFSGIRLDLGHKVVNCIVLNVRNGSGAIVGADLPGQTIIGSNNVIGHHSVVGVRCQDLKYEAGDKCFLHIGHNNDIREYSSIHRSSTSSDKTVMKMRRAYRKIFMPINTNMGQFDDRLAEVEQDKELAECPAVLSMLQSIRGSFEQDRRGICKFRNWCGS